MKRFMSVFLPCFLLLALAPLNIHLAAASPPAQNNPPLPRLTLPAGFQDETAVGGLFVPRAFVFSPDYSFNPSGPSSTGYIFILERGSNSSQDSNYGSIRVFKNGSLLSNRAITLNTCGDSERGLLGIALDPNFGAGAGKNGYIYLYYTRQTPQGTPGLGACALNTYTNGTVGPRNRISRVTYDFNTDTAGGEQILVDNIVTDVGYHNAGDLHFGADGYLYATSGDGGISSLANDPDTLNGKVLRIKPDAVDPRGYVTTGNPYDTFPNARTCGTTTPDADPDLVQHPNQDASHNATDTGPDPSDVRNNPCREVWAFGFRNPFRFTVKPGTSELYVGDVGGGSWEEIDKVDSGGKYYGWPIREGACPNGVSQSQGCNPGDPPPPNNIPFTNPVYAYPHVSQNANLDSAVTLVSYYKGTNSNYPVSYQNSLYVGDFVQGWIKRLKYNTATTNWDLQPGNFATGPSSAIGLKEGPDGNLYYLVLYTSDSVAMSEVRRIRYVGSNLKPNAVGAIVSPQSVPGTQTPLAFTFSAAGSNDPDNTLPLKYVWNFGDGGGDQPATSSLTVSHTYAAPGIYDVTLQVLDNLGMGSDVLTLKVFPGNTPASGNIQLTNLTDGSRCNTGNFTSPCIYYAGDQYQIDAVNVADPDGDGPNSDGLDANPIAWSVVFHHSTHTHPFQSNLVGASKQFVIPQEGEYDPNVWYRVHLYITDAKGQITEYVRDINPVKVTVTFQTNLVSGSQILLNAAYFPSPKVVTRVVGMQIPIDAPSPQTVGGTQYYFLNWSNAGTQSQVITVPNVNTVYTATMLSGVAPSLNFFNTHTPIVTWERISWADAYEVQVSQSASFTPLIPVGQPVSAASMALTLPCINNGVYYWRVRALRFYDSIPGSWSATQSFTVDTTGTCP